MKYREFPGTAIRVSEVGFGTWTISTGWWGEKTDAQAVDMLRRALDEHGVTFFDAADAYGNGRAERQLAEAFRGRRDQVVLATKIGYDIYDEAAQKSRRGQQELPIRTDRAFLRNSVERCLERLETDYIDVIQFHNAKMEHVRNPEIWATLRELQKEGKIRAWGAAFGPAIGWLYESVELLEREPDINTMQVIWNVLEQHPGSAMIEAARRGQQELPIRTEPAFLRTSVERCLERLETDYIDVIQFHNAKMEHVRNPEIWATLRELQREGKIRAWGAAFGPAIGWLYEAVELVEREPDINTMQVIWNVLEQHPGSAMIEAARRHAPNCCFNIRVTHASGMLEGKYTADTVFPENDHRRHRPRSWLVNGVEKVKTLDFLAQHMTLGQASLKWLLAEPLVVTTLPNIYDDEQLAEFAATSDLPALSREQLKRVEALDATNFGVTEEPMKYKGAMTRESGANTDLQEARNPAQRPASSPTLAQSA